MAKRGNSSGGGKKRGSILWVPVTLVLFLIIFFQSEAMIGFFSTEEPWYIGLIIGSTLAAGILILVFMRRLRR